MALKLLSIFRGAAHNLHRSMNRQAGVIVHQSRPSPLGFKVRLLTSSSGSGVPKDFRSWTVQRLQVPENDHSKSKLFKKKNSRNGMWNTSRKLSQKQPKASSFLKESETKGERSPFYAASWRRQEQLKTGRGKDALKAFADAVTPFETRGAQKGVKYSFGVQEPAKKTGIAKNGKSTDKFFVSSNVSKKNAPLQKAQEEGGKSEPEITTPGKNPPQDPTRASRLQQEGSDELAPEVSQRVTRPSQMRPGPDLMDSYALSRASLQALNLETVSQSMGHLSGKLCPTDLQNRDISEEDKVLPETWIPHKWISKDVSQEPKPRDQTFIRRPNQDVLGNGMDRTWERTEEESMVNGWGQGLPTDWPQNTGPKNVGRKQPNSKGNPQSSIFGKSSSALPTGKCFEDTTGFVPEVNPTNRKSIPEPLLYVTPDEIVRNKSVSFGKEWVGKSSGESYQMASRSADSSSSPKKSESPKSQLQEEKEQWLEDIRKYIQAQTIAKSKMNSENKMAKETTWESPKRGSGSTLETNKQRSPRNTNFKSVDKPINEVTSRDIMLTAVTAKATSKEAREETAKTKNKNVTWSAIKSPQQRQQKQQQQQQQPQWKPHVALEPPTFRGEPNAPFKNQSHSGEATSSMGNTSPTFLSRHNASPGIIKMAPSTQTHANKAETRKKDSTSSKFESTNDVIMFESIGPDKIQSPTTNAFILSEGDLTDKADAHASSMKSPRNETISEKCFITKEKGSANTVSKKPSPQRSKLSSAGTTSTDATAKQPRVGNDLSPEDELVFPLGEPPSIPSSLDKQSHFHRDVRETYLGNKVTSLSSSDWPIRESRASVGSTKSTRSRDEIRRTSSVSSTATKDLPNGSRGISVKRTKSSPNAAKDESRIEYYPGIDYSIFDSLDGFMAMEAREVKEPLSKSPRQQKPLPLFPIGTSHPNVGKDLSSRAREPIWSLTQGKVKDRPPGEKGANWFLDEQIPRMNLAKYHERPRPEKADRKYNKKDGNVNWKREKGKSRKPKREKKNIKSTAGDNRAIYI